MNYYNTIYSRFKISKTLLLVELIFSIFLHFTVIFYDDILLEYCFSGVQNAYDMRADYQIYDCAQ